LQKAGSAACTDVSPETANNNKKNAAVNGSLFAMSLPPAESRFQRGECSIAPEGDKQYAAHGTAEIAFPWGTSGAGVCCAYAQSDFWEES
jgi:hypothetical protein